MKRQIIEIDEELCNGCGECIPACKEGALKIINGKAKLISDKYCDGLGHCLGHCPTGALKVVEREAEEFDEEAVQKFTASSDVELQESECSCPGAKVQSGSKQGLSQNQEKSQSALSHWPVQIRLVPPKAPFLQKAHLLVTADCVPVSYVDYHRDFLQGRVALLGCPKFDDAQSYVQKFADIFGVADISEVTVLMMEVPCCSGLLGIVQKAKDFAGINCPIHKIVISTDGSIEEEIVKAA